MRIAIGSDHAGFQFKALLTEVMQDMGHEVKDFGTHSEESVDYPDYIRPVAQAVARGEYDRGVVLGGSGNGEAIVANKVKGIRCALCWDVTTARLARQHNDANVVSLGQRVVSLEAAKDLVAVFLTTAFEGGRHVRRIEKIAEHDCSP
ncbi:MAG TPA: ribose 5-phosphate isomerase B [Dehalococcoidia bacterium]|nr:ribose 5-phosphate isomerase B [Dehalococcoidia bacterium]